MLKNKKLYSGILTVVFVLIISVTAFADSFSADFAIPTGSKTEWNGKSNNKLWLFKSQNEAKFETIITNSTEKTITSELWMIRVLAPDAKILSYSITGKNGTSKAQPFTPQTSNSYYAVIKPSDSTGVNGTVKAYN